MPTLVSGIDLLGELGFFRVIIPLVLIAVTTYAMLQKIEIFGGHKGIDATVGLLLGFIVVRSFEAVNFLSVFIQYMTIVATIVLFLVMIFLFAGVKEKTIAEAMREPLAWGTIIVVVVVILFIVASQTLPQIGAVTEGELEGTGVTDKALKTLFHPTILSLIVLFSVFVVTVYMITRHPEK